MENVKSIPLSVMMENTKGRMFEAFDQIREQSNLPAYLLEGIIVDLLSQVRNQKNLELVSDMNRMNQTEQVGEQKEGE